MSGPSLAGRLSRAWTIGTQQGPRSLVYGIVEKIREKIGCPSPARRGYLAHKATVDTRFDRENGVETGGIQHLYDLTIDGANAALGINHIATDPEEFARAIDHFDVDMTHATFVDFGAGKGRAMIMAGRYPFRAILGVEFARELYEAGLSNLARASSRISSPGRLALSLGDATEFQIPDGPLVLYFYNPFGAPVMHRVAQNIASSWHADPRPMRVVYVNPVHADIWIDLGWAAQAQDQAFTIFAPPA